LKKVIIFSKTKKAQNRKDFLFIQKQKRSFDYKNSNQKGFSFACRIHEFYKQKFTSKRNTKMLMFLFFLKKAGKNQNFQIGTFFPE